MQGSEEDFAEVDENSGDGTGLDMSLDSKTKQNVFFLFDEFCTFCNEIMRASSSGKSESRADGGPLYFRAEPKN